MALADVLLGKVDVSGRLPFTWYANESQIPAITDYNIRPTATTDGRTYMYFTGDVSYPFGYGLNYDNFSYSNISVNSTSTDPNGTIVVKATVTNNGTTVGSEVPQLYVTTPFEPASAQRPFKRLEGFQKVTLNPGQSQVVTFTVKALTLAFFDETANKFVVDPGAYGFQVGSSSANSDVKLQTSVNITGTLRELPTVVNAKPIQTGDQAAQVAQRVMFDLNKTIDPQLTVSMNDQALYGYVTKGQSTPLPAGLKVTYFSNNHHVVKVENGTLTTVGSGIATVKAEVEYNGGKASTTFTIDVAPLQFTSNPTTVFQEGTAGSFTISTDSSPTAKLTESGTLPAGLTFVDNGDGTATIAGTPPSTTGTFPLTITASNGVSPTVTQKLTVYVGTLPTIVSANSTQLVVGTNGSFTVKTTGFPAPALSESGNLPTGVTFTDNGDGTATIAGTPAAGTEGSYGITVTADNGLTPAPTQTLTLTVLGQAPTATTAVLAGTTNQVFHFGTFSFTFPAGNITVHLVKPGTTTDVVPPATSANNGSYEFDNVAPGQYQVEFVDPSGQHATQWYNVSATQAGATTVTLTADQATVGINAALS